MIAPDNKALYAALIIGAWIGLDYVGIKDAALLSAFHDLLIGLGVFHVAMSKPGE